MYVCIYVYIYVCMYLCIHICMHVCTVYIAVCIYIYGCVCAEFVRVSVDNRVFRTNHELCVAFGGVGDVRLLLHCTMHGLHHLLPN